MAEKLQREVATELLSAAPQQLQIDLAVAHPASSASEGGSVATRRLMKRNIRTRPETPRVAEVPVEEEKDDMAVLLLQQLLRGATRSHLMMKGKEKSLDLVTMLRAAEQLRDVHPSRQQSALDQQIAYEATEALMASAQGAAIAEVLDELAKEQRRMEEVQRVSELVSLAVRERRLREAQESGTRQAEEMLRERQNIVFRKAISIHNQTVDSYLQAIFEKAGAANALEEALVEVCTNSAYLAETVDELQEYTEKADAIVEGLVRGFLMPRLANQCRLREVQLEAHKHRVASRAAVEEIATRALCCLPNQLHNVPVGGSTELQPSGDSHYNQDNS
ncbi:hypothetical protein cyc_03427 [Cyclospora cayetanensis]|uniref:Uncharacterized protein n=1 Tax=Cyclospora cayetanensis TaxID=88456 RepID=A0A1D3CYZ3_9EIME|nr:hypothetical protein cyc_03427 [Cyclospora cayetanensis]